jgi:Tol biopolymer transport system component
MHVTDNPAVRDQLGKILSSPVFAKSPRMSRFLRYVVEQTLEGNGDRIKEYAIAVEVFDKSEDYDPQADSTVRTEATKLRARLSRYYETDGSADSIVITIPKGAYVPVIEDRRQIAVGRAVAPRSRVMVGIGVFVTALAVAGGIYWTKWSSVPRAAPRLIPLTSFPELEEQPTLSPDGSRVAFSWKGDIYVKEIDGDGLVPITRDPAPERWPSWSPDGRQIAFVRRGEVFLVSALGGGERKVAESLGRAVWTPDGSALLVTLRSSRYARSIFLVLLATGEKRRLTFPPDRSAGDVDMAVSPDGRTLAFYRTPHQQGGDLYAVPIAGGEARRLTDESRGIMGLTWTPDGRELVFASRRTGWFRLWRIPVWPAGSSTTAKLVEGAGDDARYPWISRPAKGGPVRLAYERHTRNFDIRRAEITRPDGAPRGSLKLSVPLIASTRADYTPAFSPDGRKIAFVSDRSGARELWVCEADGSNAVKLTPFAGPDVILPRWSPYGERLVFSALTGSDGNFESYIIASGGGTPQRIEHPNGLSMAHPIFSRDERWLYFIPGPLEEAVQAWKMPASGGAAVQITRKDASRPEESPDGKMLYYGKFGTTGLWSIPVEGGEERQVLDSITGHNWTVTPRGIYYLDFAVAPDAPKLVKLYNFQTGKVDQVGTVESTVSADFSGISVSRDGRWLLYSHVASTSSDLMLVDHFR